MDRKDEPSMARILFLNAVLLVFGVVSVVVFSESRMEQGQEVSRSVESESFAPVVERCQMETGGTFSRSMNRITL